MLTDPYAELRFLCAAAAIIFAGGVWIAFVLYRRALPPRDRQRRP